MGYGLRRGYGRKEGMSDISGGAATVDRVGTISVMSVDSMLQFYSMLILQSLSFQTAKKTFLNASRKLIKIEINNQLIRTPKHAKVRSQTLVEWAEPLQLPLHLMTEYRFQIYEEHRFGYHPEELSSVGTGKFTIDSDDSFNTWEVCSDRGNKLGLLSAKMRRKLKYAPKAVVVEAQPQIIEAQPQMLSISSIVAHLNSNQPKRGFVVLSLEGKSYKTEISKTKAGVLCFSEALEIEKTGETAEAQVELFSYDAKEDKAELVGTGVLNLEADPLERRVVVRNEKGGEVGDVFIDYRVQSKKSFDAGREMARIVQQRTKISSSRVEHLTNISATRTLNPSRVYDGNARSRPLPQKSQRISLVNHNSNIFTPTEQRFKQYRDQPSRTVSYLQDQSMDFKDSHAKIYYRGASIGRGEKSNFTVAVRGNPGVGVYNLPSIWDRY